MKAAVLSAIGGPVLIEDIHTPAPHAGEVLLRVTACGVCHTDLLCPGCWAMRFPGWSRP
jgi:D-arabinose 1-dehydrogenase-like Zn-dependent alcohol dehydrogenase